MCNRDTEDPLLRTFLDQYGLHLLGVPRESVAVGDLFVHDGTRATRAGSIKYFLDERFELPPVQVDEVMADVVGTMSRAVDFHIGFTLLDGFLSALGAMGIVNKVKLGYENKNTRSLKFRFTEAHRDSMDVMHFGKNLINRTILAKHAMFNEEYSYYAVSAVARSSSISVIGETETERSVSGALEAMHLGGLDAGVSVKNSGEGEITFGGNKRLAFGVELHELTYDVEESAFNLTLPKNAIRVMKAEEAIEGRKVELVKPALIGGPNGNAFLDLAN